MSQLTFNEFCNALAIRFPEDIREMGEYDFAASALTLPAEINFLSEKYIRNYYEWLGVNEADVLPALLECAALVSQSEPLKLYVWHAHRALFLIEHPGCYFSAWPIPTEKLNGLEGAFELLIALSGVYLYEESYCKIGLPVSYAQAATLWIGGAIGIYRASHNGKPGICPRQTHWIRHYIDQRLFRIGRFEFMTEKKSSEMPHLFRNRKTGRIVALCNENWCLTPNGLRMLSGTPESEAAFITSYREDAATARGILIDPTGFARYRDGEIELDLREYESLVSPEDTIPGMHIPAGGHMTPEAVAESFALLRDFYRRYFHIEIKAINCVSWIFNPSFERELPQSNLAKFMQEVYLYPGPCYGKDGIFFAFGRDDGNLLDGTYPEDNSLRKAFFRIARAGEQFRCGGMFLLADQFDTIGQQFYRSTFAIPGSETAKRPIA